MKVRHFLTLQDLHADELNRILDGAARIKASGAPKPGPLEGQNWGLLFLKNSTRTRVSFEVGIRRLGGGSLFLDSGGLQIGRGESLADTARILSGYLDGLVVRTFGQGELDELAAHASIPIVNALTDQWHPAQALADLLTARELFGPLEKTTWCYLGDGNNVARTLAVGAALAGYKLSLAGPRGYWVGDDVMALAKRLNPKVRIERTEDARAGVRGAQVLYTDTWISMGDNPAESEGREMAFRPYQINDGLLDAAGPDAVALHCLPAHRGQEITDRVMDGPRSGVWRQAANRLPAQMALLEFLSTGARKGPPPARVAKKTSRKKSGSPRKPKKIRRRK